MVERHPLAQLAAEASEAAAAQGDFWDYHDALFAAQPKLSRETMLNVGRELGFDTERMGGRNRVTPFLRRLLVHSGDLVGAHAGSVTLVDDSGHRYVKVAERGVSCQLGRSFPLDEGVTGQVVARRQPVMLDRYAELRRGHLTAGHPAENAGVVAIPIWWRGDVIGVNILFADGPSSFSGNEVDELELLTQLAAAGIVRAGAGDPTLSELIRNRRTPNAAGLQTFVTEVGRSRPLSPTVAQVALDLVALAERGAARRQPDARLHVAVVHQPEGFRLLVHDEGARRPDGRSPSGFGTTAPDDSSAGWREIADTAGGGISVEHVPGWGTLLRADLPYTPAPQSEPHPAPFTPRERQVLGLLATGVSDKEVAHALVISPKTVEKHVGALLRKTGAANRTAAVLTAMDRGWLPGTPSSENQAVGTKQ